MLDTLPQHVALVGPDGLVLQVNEAWHRFGLENGGRSAAATGVAANYFGVCERATGPDRREADAALRGQAPEPGGDADPHSAGCGLNGP